MPIRIAVIDRDVCTADRCRYVCKSVCPGVRIGEETIVVGEEGYPLIDENLCTGCAMCVKKCPTAAIKVVNLPAEPGKPIHRYGQNAFRLYNLPIPKVGTVAFVGKNGIGKSTAIAILARKLVPNFGRLERKLTYEDVLSISKFLGKEEAEYFTKLPRIRTAHKPQNIEALRSEVSVSAFLGISPKLDEVVLALQLTQCMDKKMSELSGGELQAVAIAKTCLEDADVYFFDEPCSHLDVAQRMRAAHLIRSIAARAPVVIVEHDLALLDYLSDFVRIFYGERGVYGVVSKVKPTRGGINEYINGMLRAENVRIRPKEVKFELRGAERTLGREVLSYPAMRKGYRGFSLTVRSGGAREGEIIGLIGPNAIGKTTFVKLLAGIEVPDEGAVSFRAKVAYKPQYIRPEEGKVRDIIERYGVDRTKFDRLSKLFELGPLLEKQCAQLSGGELQALAISIALSQEAELYLLDEPSAFLDVEMRFVLITALRQLLGSNIAFVVDHDIVLIDALCDRMILFEGIPGKEGRASEPMEKKAALNEFLKALGITMRRDPDSGRPKINKFDSRLDREQRERGQYYS